MTIQQLAKSWDVNIPNISDSVFLPDYLMQNYPSKCYFAEFFPKLIPREFAYKDIQIENEVYDLVCDRMYCAILKLWVYDDLYFEYNPLYCGTSLKKRFKRRLLTDKLDNMITSNLIEDAKDLKYLLELSKKQLFDMVFAFDKKRILIIPAWSCFFLFVENDPSLEFVSEILNKEGLYFYQKPN